MFQSIREDADTSVTNSCHLFLRAEFDHISASIFAEDKNKLQK